MIEIKNISFGAGSFCISDVSIRGEESQCNVIIGPTGSGKTLLLEAIIGFRQIEHGEIFINAVNITNLPVEKRGIAYVPQDLAIFPHLSVKENILYGLKVRKAENSIQLDFTKKLSRALGITHLLDRNVENLSGGELQRIAIARALAPGNKILLLDEPFSALHEGLKKELWFLLKRLQHDFNLSIIMVTHNIEEAFFLGDVLNVIIDGRIKRKGTKEQIYHYPNSLEVAKFLGLTNLFKTTVKDVHAEYLELDCPELDCVLVVNRRVGKGRLKTGLELVAGIRAMEVMVINPARPKSNQDNQFTGIIKFVYNKGGTHTIMFQPKNLECLLEIELPNHAYHRLELCLEKEVNVSLKSESIFMLLDD